MAVSMARVVDPQTIAGTVCLDAEMAAWQEVSSGRELGYLTTLVGPSDVLTTFRDNVIVVVTRFIVDSNVDVNDALDDAFTEARHFPHWSEQRAERFPVTDRDEGGTIQAGSYRDEGSGWLFTVTKYVFYQRGNVVYLLQCTGTTASESVDAWSALTNTVKSAHLED
ncbi:LpqN/LpqT family lipoprotein [Gordonia sp. LSe1-13]|uniref:LpqN/LpqT family lipoprotein n=1 Tax=Gordonia sesuvii TaxID=3116777 RepID=A0ABU7MG46_9ACTN|nr:LpqN/LpqT family lipoprotein [Gordonia sp. LSe1-13]